jgi:hypothetical protein
VARNYKLGHSMELKRSAPVGLMSFQEFLEYLCKVALLAFPDRSPAQAVDKLVRKLHLFDEFRVRRIIEKRGGPSCYRINYPSDLNGEECKLLTRELLAESYYRHEEARNQLARHQAEEPATTHRPSHNHHHQKVQFCVDSLRSVQWYERYQELVRDQTLVPTSGLNYSSLMLNKKLLKVLADYETQHIESLYPFVFSVRRSWADLPVPALDLGVLYVGHVYSVQLMIKNTFSVPLELSVPQLRGHLFQTMTDLTMDATVTICPGLTFSVVMEIDPMLERRAINSQEVFGAVELNLVREATILHHTSPPHHGNRQPMPVERYCVPVYYQVCTPP